MSVPTPTKARGARILLIDNYSSFTYNLYQYIAELCGIAPLVLRNDSTPEPELMALLESFDGVVLSPGPGHPSRARDFGICARLLEQQDVPILGVCLGHEGLGFVHGAVVARAPQAFHGRASRIRHDGGALFDGIPEFFEGVRYHSLAVREPLPAVLEGIAYTEEGELMAMRHIDFPHWGVQFHPESAETEFGKELLANFCALSMAHTNRHRSAKEHAAPSAPTVAVAPVAEARGWRRVHTELATERTSQELFRLLYAASPTAFWLDGESSGTVSYMGDAGGPHGYELRFSEAQVALRHRGAKEAILPCDSIFAYLERQLATNRLPAKEVQEPGGSFLGGFVGYLGYELKRECGASSTHASPWPDAHWIFCDRFLAIDHARGSVTLVALVPDDEDESSADSWFQHCQAVLAQPISSERGPSTSARQAAQVEVLWRDSPEAYLKKIQQCQEEILSGESYQLCLTTQAEILASVEALLLFESLRESNPAPYAAFLACGDFALASTSPERFLKIDRAGRVESKPIKGTAARGTDCQSDKSLAAELVTSTKERAENLMIVDLVRNDLGRSCELGSVEVEHFAALESFATVHQLVSTISGRLAPHVSALGCVRAAFPGGSMTGAPKLRSMEILEDLEGQARGPYSGSIGYLSLCGSLDLSIVIRTALVQKDRISVGVGGAITVLSNAERELEEVRLKARAPLGAVTRVSSP